jgi:hypothetical protein
MLRFHFPLIEPDRRISRIRCSGPAMLVVQTACKLSDGKTVYGQPVTCPVLNRSRLAPAQVLQKAILAVLADVRAFRRWLSTGVLALSFTLLVVDFDRSVQRRAQFLYE